MDAQKSFNYTLSHKNKMLVVSFTGELSPGVVPGLEACRLEVLAKKDDVKCIVLYFQGVSSVSPDAITVLAQMQREFRSSGMDLRLCALKEALRDKLIRMGIVRGMECTEDLKTALLSVGRQAA